MLLYHNLQPFIIFLRSFCFIFYFFQSPGSYSFLIYGSCIVWYIFSLWQSKMKVKYIYFSRISNYQLRMWTEFPIASQICGKLVAPFKFTTLKPEGWKLISWGQHSYQYLHLCTKFCQSLSCTECDTAME